MTIGMAVVKNEVIYNQANQRCLHVVVVKFADRGVQVMHVLQIIVGKYKGISITFASGLTAMIRVRFLVPRRLVL